MKAWSVVAACLVVAGCSQELPTAPDQGARKAPVASDAHIGGRRRVVAVTPPAGCVDLSGLYDVQYQGGCPRSGYLTSWQLSQSGCELFVNINPDAPSVRGSVSGSNVKLSLRNGFISCTYSLDGSGSAANGVIRATVSGPVDGPCCGSGIDTVSVVATKR